MSESKSIFSIELPTGGEVQLTRHRFGLKRAPRVSIVAGIRGDAPEGMRIAFSMLQRLVELEDVLQGQVDIYPCVNPLAAEQGERLWPFFGVDLNRLFPGRENGHPPERVAHALIEDLQGSDYVFELRGARPSFQESTQALVRSDDAAELALHANVRLVWKRTPGPAAPKTFAYQFPNTIVLEGGVGNQLTSTVGKELSDGILNVLAQLNILPEEKLPFSWASMERPVLVSDEDVFRIRVGRSGFFLPEASLGQEVEKGERIGRVIAPDSGAVREEIFSPVSGVIMAMRVQPVVSLGIMVARILLN
ncbi:MAG: succinylglutamate desuccinylase/aspartoacylase family protein [Myxococcota bacterium]|nr:succinylglutamate desuccinylase/aspartoacylase family protein [Myxococcota bacterium]